MEAARIKALIWPTMVLLITAQAAHTLTLVAAVAVVPQYSLGQAINHNIK